MRKFTLFLMSLFFSVGAMAQITANTVTYTIKSVNRGYIYYDYPQGVLYSSSFQNLIDGTPSGQTNEQFAFLRTENTPDGEYYIYCVAAKKFVTYTGENGVALDLTESPVHTWYPEANGEYYVIKVPNQGNLCINITNWEAVHGCKVISTAPDEGNKMTLTPAKENANLDAAVVAIKKLQGELIEFDWTNATPWSDAIDLPSTVLNENALAYGIKYIETEITVPGARTAEVTFKYQSPNPCALNIRGVEVVDVKGNIVAGDYHVGKAGGDHIDNVYNVKVAEAGTYKVRCYATFDSDNRANATAGTITVAFDNANVADFKHNVSFAAKYATLYLGYKVAIPEGVKAYVAVSTNNNHVQFEEIAGVIPAATAVLLENVDTKTAYDFAYTAGDAATVATNLLKGSIANRYVVGDAYVLTKDGDDVCFGIASLNKLDGAAFLNNANKVYLPAPVNSGGVKSYGFSFEDGTTAIENVEVENEVKAIYDLTGRRVEAITAPGIYIVNGKKVLVK